MSEFGIDLLAKQVADEVHATVLTVWSGIDHRAEWTPIEKLFWIAFYLRQSMLEANQYKYGMKGTVGSLAEAKAILDQNPDQDFMMFPQCQLAGWRVDFLFGLSRAEAASWLIVECDGHAYHERTKEQAAKDRSRDRTMQADGITVFRFTGSELHRNPLGCATQVYDWLVREYHRINA